MIYVPGNHDFYSDGNPKAPVGAKTTFERERELARAAAHAYDVDLLDDECVVVDDVRIIGATLWTDFSQRPASMPFADAVRDAAGRGGMNDYRMIKTGRGRSRDMLLPRQTIEAHRASVAFIESVLATGHDGPTVVATHHVPVPNDREPQNLDWCYYNDLSHLLDGDQAPALWCHGHIHRNVDRVVGTTRILANPRGYPIRDIRNSPRENPDFDERLVVEVEHDYTHRLGL
ncbi:hypothetical protein HNR60_001610 [Rhodopseudomonas rhenobacensis]|uniref:Calcineurin-like phosphoesterase domain-containing protein n=1 Tax=Rhodopseudomonas rhenobacensis TaxID=87461 RepID=A0A7W7Z2P4_9BRAD|nr:hypothetical protein [Rhodopseudomonas rhenobacensis]MBB5046861.1 hypothetical protein [Rhodopseudomonas rhenobacensis]